jgi:hypothetical protein
MGYYVKNTESHFFIPKEYHGMALQAIKDFMLKTYTADSGDQVIRSFYRVSTDDVVSSDTLFDALNAWRWDAYTEENGDIIDLSFDGEKLGEDELLFHVISPYVKEGSFIVMHGDDNYTWRWYFNGKTCKEQAGRIIWE